MTTPMPTDAEAFHAFLTRQLSAGQREKTPEELLEIWRSEYSAAVEDIREGVIEMEAGKMRSIHEVDAELRQKYSIPRGD